MPVSADDISERYLKKAIAEINELGHEVAQAAGSERVPVLGSGHPLGDVFLLKHSPQTAEVHEGVAFFGRSGQAILKSLQRRTLERIHRISGRIGRIGFRGVHHAGQVFQRIES